VRFFVVPNRKKAATEHSIRLVGVVGMPDMACELPAGFVTVNR